MLDEPTSALDPGAAEEVLAALQRLVHDLGITVVLAEHRLERVIQYADQVLVVADGRVSTGAAGVHDGRGAGRAAGRRARPPGRLGPAAAVGARRPPGRRSPARPPARAARTGRSRDRAPRRLSPRIPEAGRVGCATMTAGYRGVPVLRTGGPRGGPGRGPGPHGPQRCRQVDPAGHHGRDAGTGRRHRPDGWPRPARRSPDTALLTTVGLVPQEPADLLYATTVGA